jgi:hypothetical protein
MIALVLVDDEKKTLKIQQGILLLEAKAIIICSQRRIGIGGRFEVWKTDLAIGC